MGGALGKRPVADQDEGRVGVRNPSPCVEQHVDALLGHEPPDVQGDRSVRECVPGPELADLPRSDLAPEQLGLDRLGRDEHVIVPASDRRDEPPHVLAVGDHRVGVSVDVARRRQRHQVTPRARLSPHRRPQHERTAMQTRARIGDRQNRAARKRGDHGLVAAGDPDCVRRPAEPPCGEGCGGQLSIEVGEPRGHVALAPTEAQHLEPMAPCEPLVERDPVGGQVVGQ